MKRFFEGDRLNLKPLKPVCNLFIYVSKTLSTSYGTVVGTRGVVNSVRCHPGSPSGMKLLGVLLAYGPQLSVPLGTTMVQRAASLKIRSHLKSSHIQ